jgi:hypothetical protein
MFVSKPPFETLDDQHRLSRMDYEEFDPTDYSVVVKLRGNLPRPWKWEIYRACRCGPLERSPVFFESMAVAAKEGKRALARLLAKVKPVPPEIISGRSDDAIRTESAW